MVPMIAGLVAGVAYRSGGDCGDDALRWLIGAQARRSPLCHKPEFLRHDHFGRRSYA
jgi:hypothetical protein